MYEFALPIFSAESAVTRKEKLQKLLRASFRSYMGLKKTVKLDLLTELMGYDLVMRSIQLKHISEQKWISRCQGELYTTSNANLHNY